MGQLHLDALRVRRVEATTQPADLPRPPAEPDFEVVVDEDGTGNQPEELRGS